MTESNPEKTRWWIRLFEHPYWLTTVAFVMLWIAIVLPFAWRVHRTEQLVRAIEANGGSVNLVNIGPEWIHTHLSDSLRKPFIVPSGVVILSNEMDDAEFCEYVIPLNEIHGVSALSFTSSAITKTSLEELDRFQDLLFLVILNPDLDDDTLRKIGQLEKLLALTLSHSQITDNGLQHLYGLKNLSHLSVENTGVTEQGLEKLQQRLPSLEISDD